MLEVPELVRQRAESLGDSGRAWLRDLPDIAAVVADRWELELGGTLAAGTESLVVEAVDATGTDRIVKLALPTDDPMTDHFARSAYVHRSSGGRGCAILIDDDIEHRALLLERLGPNLHDLGLPVDRVIDIIADTLVDFWRPVPAACELPTGIDQLRWLAGFIVTTWDALRAPCPSAVVDRALDYCASRADAFRSIDVVVVHGDAHGWNTLRADGGYKFVDPEGLISHREHDLGIPMREYNEPLLAGDTAHLARERAERLARRCGADPQAVWEWGFIERVSTGFANLRDFDEGGPEFLEVARRCL